MKPTTFYLIVCSQTQFVTGGNKGMQRILFGGGTKGEAKLHQSETPASWDPILWRQGLGPGEEMHCRSPLQEFIFSF